MRCHPRLRNEAVGGLGESQGTMPVRAGHGRDPLPPDSQTAFAFGTQGWCACLCGSDSGTIPAGLGRRPARGPAGLSHRRLTSVRHGGSVRAWGGATWRQPEQLDAGPWRERRSCRSHGGTRRKTEFCRRGARPGGREAREQKGNRRSTRRPFIGRTC